MIVQENCTQPSSNAGRCTSEITSQDTPKIFCDGLPDVSLTNLWKQFEFTEEVEYFWKADNISIVEKCQLLINCEVWVKFSFCDKPF